MGLKELISKTFVGSLVKPKTMEEMENKALGVNKTQSSGVPAPAAPAPSGYQPGDIMKQEEELKKQKKGFTKGVGGE